MRGADINFNDVKNDDFCIESDFGNVDDFGVTGDVEISLSGAVTSVKNADNVDDYCVVGDVRVLLREADTSVDNFESISDFGIVYYIGCKVKFCADYDKYRVNNEGIVNGCKCNVVSST